jgi:lipopolysaccharide biosynthesis glycosyltransferase
MGIGCYYSGKYKYLKGKNKEYTDGKILIKNLDNYFNAGMIVFNVQQFQKTYSFGQIMNFATSKKWRAHDQDILNVLVENNMLLLPMKWNYTEERNIEFYAPDYIKKEYFDAKGDPKIIHYCKNKPWKIFFYGANFHYFWIFASKTPFFETIISRMKQDGLISSTSYDENMLRDAGNGEGPGLKCLIKSIFIRFGASKSRFFSGF